MRKSTLFVLAIFFAANVFGQYTQNQTMGTANTLVSVPANGGLRGALINRTFTDTTAANSHPISTYPFAQIGTTGDGNMWVRNYLATGWVLLGGGTSPSGSFWRIGGNMFPVSAPTRDIGTDATYGGAVGLMTNGVVRAIVPNGGFVLDNDTSSNKIFTINPSTKEWGYANWNNSGGGGGGSAWLLTGNSGTSPSTNWLGTNHNDATASLLLKVRGQNAGYIRSNFANDTTSPTNPQRGFLTYGLYAGDYILRRIIANPADSSINWLQQIFIGFNAGRRVGVILPSDRAGATPSDENLFVGNNVARWTRVSSADYGKGRNHIFGNYAFFRNISGSYNDGFGAFALELNNGGNGNKAFGDGALRSNIDGDFNAAGGGSSMVYNTTAVRSISVISGGLGYTVGDPITISAPVSNGPGTNYGVATAEVETVDGSGTILTALVTYPGAGYAVRGDSCFYVGNCHPAVTATAGGSGSGAVLVPVLRSGDRNGGWGTLSGAYNYISQDMNYFGYGSGKGTRYWDEKGLSIGSYSGVSSSVPSSTPITNYISFGYESEVSESNTAALGDSTTYALKWVINGSAGDSALKVNGGVNITGGVRIGGFPQPNTSAKNYFAKVSSNGTVTNSRMIEITNGTGNYVSIDDAQTGATTTNNFLFNVANNYTGDLTSSTNPLIYFGSRSSSVTDLNVIKMEAASMPTSSSIGFSIGKSSSLNNMFFLKFRYNGAGSTSNYIEQQFAANANISRTYASGNVTIGASVTTDNGYNLEVGGKVRLNDSLWGQGPVRFSGLASGIPTGAKRVLIDADGNLYSADTTGGGGSSGITVGTTTITSGTSTRVGFNDGGVYGEDAGLAYDKTTDILSIGVAANVPTIYGGTGTTSDLNLKTTTGVGTTGADMHFLVGNNGGTEAMSILNSGAIGFNSNSPVSKYNFYLPVGTAPSTTWTTDHFVIGEPGGTGAGLGIMRHNGTNAVRLYSVAPNVAWNPLEFYFSSSAFYGSGSNLGISIAATGNVGIKTTTSTDALNISGSLSMISGRHKTAQGADVASANNLALGSDGNTFEITGTTQVNLISNTNWQTGSTITLLLASGITIKHGQATSGSNITILLNGAADLVTAAASSITLSYTEFGGTNAWRQVGAVVSY